MQAQAQQPERVRRIGVLFSLAEDDPESVVRRAAFEQALKEKGWINGGNLRIDYRWASGDPELIRKFVAELVASAPDVIVTSGSQVMGHSIRVRDDAVARRRQSFSFWEASGRAYWRTFAENFLDLRPLTLERRRARKCCVLLF